jgi:L-2,3-diaminopropanoate---citrate ligase
VADPFLRTVDEILATRLLNIFLREVGGASQLPPATLSLGLSLPAGAKALSIDLPATHQQLVVALRRASLCGHHEFHAAVYVRDAAGGGPTVVDSPIALARLLVAEIGARHADASVAGSLGDVIQEIHSSVEATHTFAARRRGASLFRETYGVEASVESEQAVAFGHPFHQAAKSVDPCWAAEMSAYRPELGTRFQLHYLAVDPYQLREERALDVPEPVPADVRREAAARLPNVASVWPLLPCHPWQARMLLARPTVEALLQRGALFDLGLLGEEVFPTSSVRTVYLSHTNLFFKLPLDVRITNFVRTNPAEQIERTLAANRLLQWAQQRDDNDGERLGILYEVGYRALASDEIFASSAVLFRQGFAFKAGPPLVLAALLEPSTGGKTPLTELISQAAQSRHQTVTAAFVCSWLRCYLSLSLRPALRLLQRYGISLEAHVQNTLLACVDGWPSRVYVRDLEGTSVDRERAAAADYFGGLIAPTSSLFVDAAEAQRRFTYYVLTNQVAHVIATLAAHTAAEEWQLWQVVRGELETAPPLGPSPWLTERTWPAKANFISRVRGQSQKPCYVTIPNPIRRASES